MSSIEKRVEKIEKEIEEIKERNKRVECDKAWETSLTRKFLICLFTYIAIGIYLEAVNIPNPWINAIVPSVAFLLSTLTLPFFKKIWKRYVYKKFPKIEI